MALVCPACGTENRSAARFCIECIAPLPTDFAPTLVASPTTRAMDVDPYEGLPSVLAAFVASRPGAASASGSANAARAADPQPATAPRPAPVPERRRGLWVSVAAFAIAMVIGAGGWLIAGAGGWYIYSSTGSGEPGASPASATPAHGPVGVAAAAVAPAGLGPASAAAPAEPAVLPVDNANAFTSAPASAPDLAPAAAPAVAPPQISPTAAAAATTTRVAPAASAPRAAPRDSTPARKSAPVEDKHTPAKVAARGEARETPAAQGPSQLCGDLNFIARARCMAAQCATPQFSRHGECVAVREQQRLMELKRNPQLLD